METFKTKIVSKLQNVFTFVPERNLNLETKEKIMEGCESLFLRFGVKSVTMDEVARELGISKKTLYQHFRDKTELVCNTFQRKLGCNASMFEEMEQRAETSIHLILQMTIYLKQELHNSNPRILFEIRKYFPQAWSLFNNYKEDTIYQMTLRIIDRGRKEGLIREDFNAEVVSQVFVSLVEIIMDTNIFPVTKFNFITLHGEMVRYHLRSIATPKGLELMEQLNFKDL